MHREPPVIVSIISVSFFVRCCFLRSHDGIRHIYFTFIVLLFVGSMESFAWQCFVDTHLNFSHIRLRRCEYVCIFLCAFELISASER